MKTVNKYQSTPHCSKSEIKKIHYRIQFYSIMCCMVIWFEVTICRHTHRTKISVCFTVHTNIIPWKLETRPMHKAFVTVPTGQYLGVFGSSSTTMVPGGANALCNLSPIVLLSKFSPGTGYNYVVARSYLVNHLPFRSYISPSNWMSWKFVGKKRERRREGQR